MRKFLVSFIAIATFCFAANAQINPRSQDREKNAVADNFANANDKKYAPSDAEKGDRFKNRKNVKRRGGKNHEFIKNLSAEQKQKIKEEFQRHRAVMSEIIGREFNHKDFNNPPKNVRKSSEDENNKRDGARYHKRNNSRKINNSSSTDK